jgi:hypothetical protein
MLQVREAQMLERTRTILMILGLGISAATALGQSAQGPPPCPGFNPNHNVNLACEIPTAIRISTSGSHTLGQLTPTLAAQLSQLPVTTAISGTGITFTKGGLPTISTDSLGTILTQRGETIGKHQFIVSFNYQRFGFGSVDGIGLKHINTVDTVDFGTIKVFRQAQSRIDLTVDQFTAIGSFGLTNKLDVSLLVPFAKVNLKTQSSGHEFDFTSSGAPITDFTAPNTFLFGSATGLGDLAVNLKYNVVKLEHTSIAIGNEVRFPTGDETNFLGTGAYGLKPYFVLSRRGRITPNINIGYQWNGSSILLPNRNGAPQNLPSSFLYSGGADFKVIKRLTLTAEFLGQVVINGPRLASSTTSIPGQANFASITTQPSSYGIDNLGLGLKVNAFKGLQVTGDILTKLDDGGLRSKVIPLVGVLYRFSKK